MRVTLLGKGGSGKSSLAGMLCTALAARGDPVVAIDADSVPGLANVLGMPPTDDWFLAGEASRQNGGWQLEGSPAEIVGRCSRRDRNGIRFLQLGNADSNVKDFELSRWDYPERWSATMAFNTIVKSYDEQEGWVVIDLQGGTVQVSGGFVGTSGVALVVVEPFAKSVLTARRFVEMGAWPRGVHLAAVANKVTGSDDGAYLQAELTRIGLPLWASVPVDPALVEAERAGRPLVTAAGGSLAGAAVETLVDRLFAIARGAHGPTPASPR